MPNECVTSVMNESFNKNWQFGCNRSNIKATQCAQQKFCAIARKNPTKIKECDLDIPFSFAHNSINKYDINAKPNILENRELRGHGC